MQLVEKHVIKQRHRFYQEIDQLCFLSKNLYNLGNYLMRQAFINSNESLGYYDIQKQLQSSVDYKALPSKVSQQVLMVLDRNWKSFKEALKSWFETQSRFLGKPKLPKYKHKTNGRNIVIYTKQALSKPALEDVLKGMISVSTIVSPHPHHSLVKAMGLDFIVFCVFPNPSYSLPPVP